MPRERRSKAALTRQQVQEAVQSNERRSASFEAYYRAQLFAGDAAAFEQWLARLRTPAPMTLRVGMAQPETLRRRTCEVLKSFAALQPLSWVDHLLGGDGLSPTIEAVAYQCGHNEYHADPKLMEYCKSAHSAGAVSFQESVSMLPALLLQAEPHHAVVDLCAAPGSKTTLILDIMHRRARQLRMPAPTTSPAAGITSGTAWQPTQIVRPSGLLVANDFDAKRCRLLLAKRVRQVLSPCAAVMIGSGQSVPLQHAFFDRVLADVREISWVVVSVSR
jgi:multisite-specific tRNA:(cytosine-C5)-methyltransferase